MKTVLFICVHNAGRSQMAEAFFNKLAKGEMKAYSAGSQPGDRVHPIVAEAMLEVGIDISRNHPRLLTQEIIDQAELAISMGCGESTACPAAFIPTRDWALEDPKGKPIEEVRAIRDDIKHRVEELIAELKNK